MDVEKAFQYVRQILSLFKLNSCQGLHTISFIHQQFVIPTWKNNNNYLIQNNQFQNSVQLRF